MHNHSCNVSLNNIEIQMDPYNNATSTVIICEIDTPVDLMCIAEERKRMRI